MNPYMQPETKPAEDTPSVSSPSSLSIAARHWRSPAGLAAGVIGAAWPAFGHASPAVQVALIVSGALLVATEATRG